jgi:hypothetical protein
MTINTEKPLRYRVRVGEKFVSSPTTELTDSPAFAACFSTREQALSVLNRWPSVSAVVRIEAGRLVDYSFEVVGQ